MEDRQKITISIASWVKAIVVIGVAYALYMVSDMVLVVIAAIVIASAIEPVAIWAKRRGVPRLPTVISVYLTSVLVFAGLFYFLLLPLVGEMSGFLRTLTIYSNSVVSGGILSDLFRTQNLFGGIDTPIIFRELSSHLNNLAGFLSQGIFSSLSVIFGGVLNFILIIVLSFYLVVEEDGIGKFLRIVTPLKHEDYVIGLWRRAQGKIGLWMQGQLLASAMITVLVYIGLVIAGVPHALLLAVAAGVFELIPIFGPIIASIPALFIAFISGGATDALIVGAIYLVVQQIESNIISPQVHKKLAGVPPMVSILSIVIGWELAGFLGVLISVPVAASVIEFISDFGERKGAKMSGVHSA